jgi:hypothetical protein
MVLQFCCVDAFAALLLWFLQLFWPWSHLKMLFLLNLSIPWWKDERYCFLTHFIIGCDCHECHECRTSASSRFEGAKVNASASFWDIWEDIWMASRWLTWHGVGDNWAGIGACWKVVQPESVTSHLVFWKSNTLHAVQLLLNGMVHSGLTRGLTLCWTGAGAWWKWS